MTEMDYVQEELARQRHSLAVLMMGGRAGREEKELSERVIRLEKLIEAERTGGVRSLREEAEGEYGLAQMTGARMIPGEPVRKKRSEEMKWQSEAAGMPKEHASELAGDGVIREETVTEILWADDG